MKQLTPSEVLLLREMLQMETNALAKAKVTQAAITDQQLKSQAESEILAAEGKVKAMQQFITENNLLTSMEVQ